MKDGESNNAICLAHLLKMLVNITSLHAVQWKLMIYFKNEWYNCLCERLRANCSNARRNVERTFFFQYRQRFTPNHSSINRRFWIPTNVKYNIFYCPLYVTVITK